MIQILETSSVEKTQMMQITMKIIRVICDEVWSVRDA